MAVIKKTNKEKCWQERGQGEPLNTADGNANYSSHYGTQYIGFLKQKQS